jgi:hypothetical protein
MSWDIFVQDIPEDARTITDIPDNFRPRPLGPRSEVLRLIREVVPQIDFSNPSWGVIEGPDYSVDLSISETEDVASFVLHVRGGDTAAGLVADLLTRCGWRALDPASESGIFDPDKAIESLRKWRSYRDRVLATGDERAG